MAALITILLVLTFFGIVGGFIGYWTGYDKAWLEAVEFVEEEVTNGIQN